jgi:endonuclease-3
MAEAKTPAPRKSAAKSAKKKKRTTPSVGNPGRVLKKSRYTKAETYAIFERFHADNPEPEGELDYVNAYTLLVAVVLSAQATDVGVNRATKHLFQIADTPEKMLALGEDKVREEIRTIGLFKTKAKNVILLSEQLIRDHDGEVPEDREALEKLPGVGRKTANVVLNIFFGHPTIAVDTHLFRLGNRIGIAPGKTPLDVEKAMEKAVPAEFGRHAHHWLILHGRYICKARKPECRRCVIYDLCKSPEKEPLDSIPEIALRTRAQIERQKAAVS